MMHHRIGIKINPTDDMGAIILFALVTPVLMTYGLSTGNTPYWLFGLIFLLLGINLFLRKDKHRIILTWSVILITVGSVFFSSVIVRSQVAPVHGVHDIILQLEAATRYLTKGVNPYVADYFGTALEEWYYSDTAINPALYHFVMPPFYLLSFIPFYFFGAHFFSIVDGRLPLFFAFVGILWILNKIVPKEDRALALGLFAFNPATLSFFLEGRSDIQMFWWLLLSLYVLGRKQFVWSGILMGLAFATKQSAWPIFPLYVAYLYFSTTKSSLIKGVFSFTVAFGLVTLPFLLWDARAFFDSTILYLNGSLPTSYPISGYGIGMMLNQFGLIKDLQGYFPFWIYQLIFGLPVLVYLINYLRKKPTVRNLLFSYGIFLFVFWYLSRYFNNSHVGFLTSIFIVAYFWPQSEIKKNADKN